MRIHVRVRSFPGSDEERLDLIAAVRRHCACADVRGGNSPVGVMHEVCAPHDLLGQEPILKRLVFYRRWHRSRRE